MIELAVLLASALVTRGPAARLEPVDLELLRGAARNGTGFAEATDSVGFLIDELRRRHGLAEIELERIEGALRRDPRHLRALDELRSWRILFRENRAGESLVLWDIRQREEGGSPRSAPSLEILGSIERVMRAVATEMDLVTVPALTIRLDLDASATRLHGAGDLRHGVEAHDNQAAAAAAEVVARAGGAAPALAAALGQRLACATDGRPGCEPALMDHARATWAMTGAASLHEMRAALVVGGSEDPAHATAVLLLAAGERAEPPVAPGALAAAFRADASPDRVRLEMRRLTGHSLRDWERMVAAVAAAPR